MKAVLNGFAIQTLSAANEQTKSLRYAMKCCGECIVACMLVSTKDLLESSTHLDFTNQDRYGG
jgi:hypothetical protein